MGRTVKGTYVMRQAIRRTVGEDRYKALVMYTDTLNGRYKVKVQQLSWISLDDDEVQAIVNYVQDNYGVEVEVKRGESGAKHLEYVAFYINREVEVE